MPVSLNLQPRQARSVLLINDDSLSIYAVRPGHIQKIGVYTWSIDNFVEVVADAIARECSRKPVVIINDQVEQFYRKERLPSVSFLDQARIVDRKLGLVFPAYPMRTALRLKDDATHRNAGQAAGPADAQGQSQTRGNLYLFAAAPRSDFYIKSLEAAKMSLAQIDGYVLLPVETCDMVTTLSQRLAKRAINDKKSAWSIFIGQHSNGSLRQIVVKNGELALTRLTPVVDTDIEAGLWASEVDRELKGTLGYLSRFGFTPEQGLDVIVITNQKAGQVLREINDVPCNYYTLSAQDAGQLLGIKIQDHEDDRYADILHAGWIGQKPSLHVPIVPKDMLAVSLPRRAAFFGSMLLFAAFLGAAGMSGLEMYNYYKLNRDIEVAQDVKKQLQAEYDVELNRKESLGINVKLMKGAILVDRQLSKRNLDPVFLVEKIGAALPEDLRLDKVDMKIEPAPPEMPPGAPPGSAPPPVAMAVTGNVDLTTAMQMVMRLGLSFPADMKPEDGNKRVQELRLALVEQLPGYDVVISRLVADLQFTGTITRETGVAVSPNANSQTPQTAEIAIIKRLGGEP